MASIRADLSNCAEKLSVKESKGGTFLGTGNLSDRPKTDYCQLAVVMCTLCSTTLCTHENGFIVSQGDESHRDN